MIALIITIIVLLILATVSIVMLTGENGMLEKTQNAKQNYRVAAARELLELKISEIDSNYYQTNSRKATFGEIVNELKGTNDFVVLDNDIDLSESNINNLESIFVYSAEYQDIIFEIANDENRTIGLVDGTEPQPKKYLVTYDANGGENAPIDSKKYKENDIVNIDFTNLPTREKYTFEGWATSNDATEAKYTVDGENTFIMGTENETLYAVWSAKKVYLYNYGDECTSLTGGWIEKDFCDSSGAVTTKKDEENKCLKIYSTNRAFSSWKRAGFITSNKIDFSEYTKLYIIYDQNTTSQRSNAFMIAFGPNNVDSSTNNDTYINLGSGTVNKGTQIGVSLKNEVVLENFENSFLAVYLTKGYSYVSNTINVYQIWLE